MNGERATDRANKAGKDWWGKKPLAGTAVSSKGMKLWKRILHKIERQQAINQIRKEL